MAENKAQNTQKNTQKKDADRKKDARNRKRMGNQREIWLSAGSIGVLFLCLLVYLGHFVATSEQDMINNSYNSRQQILLSRSARVINENGKKHKYMRNTPKSVWTAKLRMKRRLEIIRIRICFLIS